MPVFTIPVDDLSEFNPCHTPAGSEAGGQFCGRDAFVGVPGRKSPKQTLLEPYGEEAAAVAESQRRLIGKMASDGNEHMVVHQPGAHPFYFTSGSPVQVEVPHDNFMDECRANPPTFTAHTHPTGCAPSLADIRMQVRSRSKRQIIFGPGGEWYEIEITDFAKAEKVIDQGRRARTYWEEPAKGKFATDFDRLKNSVKDESRQLTNEWAEKKFGLTAATNPTPHPSSRPSQNEGFLRSDGGWISRYEAGKLHPEIKQHHMDAFADLAPRIWLKLREKHDWFKFRHYRRSGPYATSTH